MNIINFDDPVVSNSKWIQKAREKAINAKMDFHEYLSKFHGIDVIINHHVLVQNSALLALDRPLEKIIQSMSKELVTPDTKGLHAIQMLEDYVRFEQYAKAAGVKVPAKLDLARIADQAFTGIHESFRGKPLDLVDLMKGHPEWYQKSSSAQKWVYESGLKYKQTLLDPKAPWTTRFQSHEIYSQLIDLNEGLPKGSRLPPLDTLSVISLKNPENFKHFIDEMRQNGSSFDQFMKDQKFYSNQQIHKFWTELGLLPKDRAILRKVMIDQGIWGSFPWEGQSQEDRSILRSLMDQTDQKSIFQNMKNKLESRFVNIRKQVPLLSSFSEKDLLDGGLLRAISFTHERLTGTLPEHLKSDFQMLQNDLIRMNRYQEQIQTPYVKDFFETADLVSPIRAGSSFQIHAEKVSDPHYRLQVIERISNPTPTDEIFEVLHHLRGLEDYRVSTHELYAALPKSQTSKLKKWVMSDAILELSKESTLDFRLRYQKGDLLSNAFYDLPWDPKEDAEFLKKLYRGNRVELDRIPVKDPLKVQKITDHFSSYSRKASGVIQDLITRSPELALTQFQDLKVDGLMNAFEIQPIAGGLKVRDSFDGFSNPFARHIENQVLKLKNGFYDSQSETLLKFLKNNPSPQSSKIIQTVLQDSPSRVVAQAKRCLVRADGSRTCTGTQMVRGLVQSVDP